MRIIIAPDSFKGSLTAAAAADAMETGIRDVIGHDVEIHKIPMADGGEGTTICIVKAAGGRLVEQTVTGPLGDPVQGCLGLLNDGRTAVIEIASASGLYLIPEKSRNPLVTTSFGTGELIRAALDHGCREIFLGLGGSATSDGGAGILQALGVNLLDEQGRQLGRGAMELRRLAQIGTSAMDQRLLHTRMILGCDVDNPLCGPNGAAAVYGPQKGATPEMVGVLSIALERLADVAQKMGHNIGDLLGGGAAGGAAAGLSLIGGGITSGIAKIIELTGLERYLAAGVDLLLTGEGEFNSQTLSGKVPVGLGRISCKYGTPVITLAGSVGVVDERGDLQGIEAIMPIGEGPLTLEAAMKNAAFLLRRATSRVMRMVIMGSRLDKGDKQQGDYII